MRKISLVVLTMFINFSLLNAKVIAKVPEASGICFIQKTDTLIVVNDEGWIYKLSRKGKILSKTYLGKYDLEGIAYDRNADELYLVNEKNNSILLLQRESLKILREIEIKKKFKGKKILTKSTKHGLEAIALLDGELYLSHQASVVFKIKINSKNKSKITEVYKHGYKDIAGLTFHKRRLYMVSDKQNLLIEYDIKNNKTIKKIKLPTSAQEGICFDNKNNIYIADDNGRVLKYKTKKLGIK